MHDSTETTNWTPSGIDLAITAAMTLGFPFIAGMLLGRVGALLPMVLYYGAAWGICIWRRGGSGYSLRRLPAPPVWFYVNVGVIVTALVLSYFARIEAEYTTPGGVVFTALVWAVVNAASEQLLWIYIFDSWDLFGQARFRRTGRFVFRISGLLLFTAFVGTIHTMYWAKFLHTVDAGTAVGILFVVVTTVSGYLHILVWRRSGRMVYTFIPHFMLNLFPLFWTGYSIVPYLIGGLS